MLRTQLLAIHRRIDPQKFIDGPEAYDDLLYQFIGNDAELSLFKVKANNSGNTSSFAWV
jgi:hypothetical protein